MQKTGGPLDNAARNLRQIAHSPVSWAWALTVWVVHAGLSLAGGEAGLDLWFGSLGLSRDGFLSGKVWQLASYGFLHGAWWHALVNSLFVLVIGSRIEHMTGRATTVRVIAAGMLGGGVFHLLLGSGLLVGLSGGCMALLLLLTTLSPQSRMMPLPVSGRSLGLGLLAAALLLALLNPDLGIPGFSSAGKLLGDYGAAGLFRFGHACHFGGGLAGWLFGRWLLRPRITLKRLRRERARREAGEAMGSRRMP